MKKIDELLDDYNIGNEKLNIEEEYITKEEKDRIKKITLEKVGYNQKSTKKRYIIPMVAVMTLILSFAVVFAQGGLSSIYYKLFGEEVKYVNELGTEINESYSNNGITLNVASMLGDENSFYIIFEVINENGESFKDLDLNFENFNLDFKGSGGYTWYNIQDDDENDNKATILLIGNTTKKAVGKKMIINAKDMTSYRIVEPENKFEPYKFLSTNEEYLNQSLLKNYEKSIMTVDDNMTQEEKEKVEYTNNLMPDEILPFKYANIKLEENNNNFVDNIGFVEGRLCIRFGLRDSGKQNLGDMYFENKNNTDDLLYGFFINSEFRDGIMYQYYSFDIKDMEELKNYVLYYNIVKENKIVEGEWSITFKADYKNTSQTIKVNKEVTIDNKRYLVKELKLSPISLNIELINNLEDKIKNPVSNFYNEVTITMKDGKNIDLISSGANTNPLKSTINMIFEKPIDVKQIYTINIGNLTIKINQ